MKPEATLRPGDPFQIAIGLWVLVHGITSLLLATPAFPWPHELNEDTCCPVLMLPTQISVGFLSESG